MVPEASLSRADIQVLVDDLRFSCARADCILVYEIIFFYVYIIHFFLFKIFFWAFH